MWNVLKARVRMLEGGRLRSSTMSIECASNFAVPGFWSRLRPVMNTNGTRGDRMWCRLRMLALAADRWSPKHKPIPSADPVPDPTVKCERKSKTEAYHFRREQHGLKPLQPGLFDEQPERGASTAERRNSPAWSRLLFYLQGAGSGEPARCRRKAAEDATNHCGHYPLCFILSARSS